MTILINRTNFIDISKISFAYGISMDNFFTYNLVEIFSFIDFKTIHMLKFSII